jgi:nicotinate-nucleotide adenylyltransferase
VNIGVLGGTFDPVHNGHLAIARQAKRKLSLSRVLFVPAGQPWLKVDDREITNAQHRVNMVELAINNIPYFELTRYEIDHQGPSYTVDTMIELRKGLGSDIELYLILGWDSLIELPKWHKPAELIKLCKLAAITRGLNRPPTLDALEKEVPGIKQSTILLNMKPIDISSTDIRNRVARGLSIKGLVPEAVADYIQEQKLYR